MAEILQGNGLKKRPFCLEREREKKEKLTRYLNFVDWLSL